MYAVMGKSEENENSLRGMMQHIIPRDNHQCCPSIQHLIFTVEDWETNIEVLEERLKHVQREIKNLGNQDNKNH